MTRIDTLIRTGTLAAAATKEGVTRAAIAQTAKRHGVVSRHVPETGSVTRNPPIPGHTDGPGKAWLRPGDTLVTATGSETIPATDAAEREAKVAAWLAAQDTELVHAADVATGTGMSSQEASRALRTLKERGVVRAVGLGPGRIAAWGMA